MRTHSNKFDAYCDWLADHISDDETVVSVALRSLPVIPDDEDEFVAHVVANHTRAWSCDYRPRTFKR